MYHEYITFPLSKELCTTTGQHRSKQLENIRTAPGVCGNGSVSLSHSGSVVTRTGIHTHSIQLQSGEPGKVDRVLALHARSRGFDSRRGHMSERFFRSSRPGYPHPVSSELKNSGIRVAVGDCSVTERRRWRPPYQTGKTVQVQAKHHKHNEDGRTAPGMCGNGSVPLCHSGNVVTRIGTHTHTNYMYTITGRMHGAPYRGYGYVPLRFGGTSLGKWEHNNNNKNNLYNLIHMVPTSGR